MFTNNSPENILHTAYEAKMISSGDNSPSIKIKGTKLQYLLVLIHLGFESNVIKMMLNWTNDEFEKRVNLLEAEGLLKQIGGRYYPTCMIITACEGEKLYNLCEPLIKSTDLFILNEIANTISEDLVLLFNENDKPLKQYFASSRYSKEITYAEFFIWWYHFFYTKVTEELIKQGVIRISSHKNQTYIIY